MIKYNHSWIEVDGVNTHYIEAGEGDPLVLVHGGLPWSSGETEYNEVLPILSKDFHVLAPDLIGFGYTDPRGPEDYPGQAQGEFLLNFIKTLDIGSIYLAGNSYSGFTTQYVAHRCPELIKRLIITNSLGGSFPIPPLPEGEPYIFQPGKRAYEELSINDIEKMLEKYYAHKDLVTEERVKLIYETYNKNYEYTNKKNQEVNHSVEASNINRSYKGKHVSEWAHELEMPVLLMWSEPGSKIDWGIYLLKRIPGCEMHILPWSGHHLFMDQSERWAQVVTNWLKNETARAPN